MNQRLNVHTHTPSRCTVTTGYAACGWAWLFAAAHVYWALGGTMGLPHEPPTSDPSVATSWEQALGWSLSVVLFATVGLFPLALVRGDTRIGRAPLHVVTLLLGYLGMVLVALYGALVSHESGMIVGGLAVCALGGVTAMVRPRRMGVAPWMVLVATGALGGAMVLYGGAYLAVAVADLDAPNVLVYVFTGGVLWLGEGMLFVATAWLARGGTASQPV